MHRYIIGALSGLLASMMISLLILIAEVILGYPFGIFYTIIVDALLIDVDDRALVGLMSHLLTGCTIGVIASIPYRYFTLDKSMLYGIIVGVSTWAIIFLPVSYLFVMPFLESNDYTLLHKSGSMVTADELKIQFERIIYSSIGFHLQYGLVYSIISYYAIRSSVYKDVQDLV